MSLNSSNKTIARNALFLYLRMFFVLLVSLYTSRVVLNVLGISDYGVYNVVAGFVLLFGFLNATLSASMQRFYNYEGGKRGTEGYKDVYSTGFWIHVLIAVIIFILLESFGIWYINNVMVIDLSRLYAAKFIFQFSTFSMIFLIMQIPYLSAIIANEKMDYFALISIVDIVFKLIVVIALSYIPYDKLITYGFLILSIAVLDFLFYFIYAKKQFYYLKLSTSINRNIFKELFSFSGWNLIGTFAFLLKGQGLNLLLNGFFNTAINAARGIAFQVHSAISGFTNNAATAFKPQIVHSFAVGELERTKFLMFSETKICYYLILVLIIPVTLEIDYLLSLWLGESVPPLSNIFTVLVLFDLLFSTLNAPTTQVAFATGKIRKYQIYSSLVNLLLLPICYLYLKQGYPAEIVFVISIIFTLVNQVVCLMVLHSIFRFSYSEYFRQIIIPCILVTFFLPIVPYLLREYMPESFIRFILISFATIVLSFPLLYFIILTKNERGQVKQLLINIVLKFKK